MKRLVLLGGGYGGMRILQKLFSSDLPEDLTITLVDRNPYHSMKRNIMHLLLEQQVTITSASNFQFIKSLKSNMAKLKRLILTQMKFT